MHRHCRDKTPYTPLFCEENIWWLARNLLADKGVAAERLRVLVMSNPAHSIVLFSQRSAELGQPVCWDYHVVLHAELDGATWIFDPDSRLPCPTPCMRYVAETFPEQAALPERFRTQVRVVPATSYLAHFHSDRHHMLGQIPPQDFPDYPVITPAAGVAAIDLSEYRDMSRVLPDGSQVLPVAAFDCEAPDSQPLRAVSRRPDEQS
jgi:hypothetical protein